jgi:hypothetical protein
MWRLLMSGWSARGAAVSVAFVILGGGLAGCTTMAGFSYSEYQAGPGFQTERVYENRVYGDTEQGLGSETCRMAARREAGASGEILARRETVCEEF